MEIQIILVYQVIQCPNETEGEATGMDKPQELKDKIRIALEKDLEVVLDMSNMRSLSPSFAYEAFGKLYDIFGDELSNRLKFVNDDRNLQERVFSALKRRREVLRFQ